MDNLAAINGIKDILDETLELHGWTIPNTVVSYTVRILADKVDKMPWQPEPSYAEAYLKLKTPAQALELGDTCFFTRSVFPELMNRRGLSSDYFVQLGQGSYSFVLNYNELPHIRAIRDNFEFLAEVVHTAVRYHGHWRSMWE